MPYRRRSNPSLTAALCGSLLAHGLGLSALVMWFVWHAPRPYAPPFDDADVARVILHPPPPPRLPRPTRKPPPPPPPVDESQAFRDDSGEHGGHGTFNRSTKGDEPMTGRRAADQADLMRGPRPDDALLDPTQARTAQVGQPVPEDALPLAAAAPPDRGVFQPRPAAVDPTALAAAPAKRSHALGPLPPPSPLTLPADPTDDAATAAAPSGTPDAVARASPTPPASPPKRESGRLAVASDTDSAAFTADADHTYHAGRTDARNGKKVRFVDPHYGDASKFDLSGLGGLHAVMAVRVEPDAHVVDVQLVHSSGSTNVDEDIKRSCWYDQFEPDQDKAGHPIPTTWVILFE